MGASVTKNVINITNKVISQVSTKIIQNTRLSEDSSQIISVKNIDGDVYVVGNVFYQRASVNIGALMKALVSQEAQMALLLQMSQEAKSLISGLNIGQYADSRNTMNELIEVSMSLMTEITQSCAASLSQRQSIVVKRVKGNVYIQDNVFDQVADLMSKCVSDIVSSSQAVADLKEKLDQKASASAEGLSGWIIVAIIAVIIGLPVIGGIVGGYAVLKFIFPLLTIVGAGLMVAYATWTTRDVKLKGFSVMIGNSPSCLSVAEAPATVDYKTAAAAADSCLKDKKCVAMDFNMIDYTGGPKAGSKPVKPPLTTFYSYVSDRCAQEVKADDSKTMRVADIYYSAKDPLGDTVKTAKAGDAFINTATSGYFTYTKNGWQFARDLLSVTPFDGLVVSDKKPSDTDPPAKAATYYAYYNKNEPVTLTLYAYDRAAKTWTSKSVAKGPGLVPNVGANVNSSGFIVYNKKIWLLYSGIAAVVLGILGSIYTYAMSEKPVPAAPAKAKTPVVAAKAPKK